MPQGGFFRSLGRALNPLGQSGGNTGTAGRIAMGGALGGPVGAGAVAMGQLFQRLRNRQPNISGLPLQRPPLNLNPNLPQPPIPQYRPSVFPATPGAPPNVQDIPLTRPQLPIAIPVNGPPGYVPPRPNPMYDAMSDSFGNQFPGSQGGAMSLARAGETSQPRGSSFMPEYTDLSERDPYNRLAYKFSSMLRGGGPY